MYFESGFEVGVLNSRLGMKAWNWVWFWNQDWTWNQQQLSFLGFWFHYFRKCFSGMKSVHNMEYHALWCETPTLCVYQREAGHYFAYRFFCTRVACNTEQDWAKLKQVLLEYLNGTDNMMGKRKIRVDASYAVHRDMKSHTGGVISFGRAATMSKLGKQTQDKHE